MEPINRISEFLEASVPEEISGKDFQSEKFVQAFNEGCDARILGKNITHNPYESYTTLYTSWKNGWRDVDRYWGCEAFWTHKELVPVSY